VIESFLGKQPRIHENAFVHDAAVLIGDIDIGACTSVWPCATLRGDDGPIVIGEYTSIQDNCVIHCTRTISKTTVGSRCTIGHGVILHGCTVGDDCLIGMGSTILDNVIIESGAFVAAGTLIPPGKVVKAGTMVRGNPFTVVRECTDKDREWIDFGWREYATRAEQYLAARKG
jgi:carbonic anhydrase/acetyltransferase-like protein (isoleucine patch superfamily)